jgi:hypothetical protein
MGDATLPIIGSSNRRFPSISTKKAECPSQVITVAVSWTMASFALSIFQTGTSWSGVKLYHRQKYNYPATSCSP